MDSHIKTGKVYLKPHKPHKKWKLVRLSLFAPSSSSVGRLEIGDGGGGADLRKKVKVVRLSELISVLRLPPNAEACHLDNMSTFCVETEDRTLVFAAPKDDCLEWVDKLRHSSFQREKSSGSSQVHMEENQIYASADEAPLFWVVVQKNDAATRCGLQGSYWLQLEQQSLLLRDTKTKTKVVEWPYELLRRYGHDKVSFTVEAGRRCESGPGTFCFETQQADKIFNLIQSNIKRNALAAASGSQSQDTEKVLVTNIQPHSPLPKIPDLTNMADILENKLRMQDRRSPVFDNMAKGLDEVGASDGSPAPITLMPLPSIPTLDGTSRDKIKSQSDAIYADPNVCGPSIVVPKLAIAQYIDPAKVLPLKPPFSLDSGAALPTASDSKPDTKASIPDSVYSEVYDKISPDKNKQPVLQNATKTSDEPIYSEPVSRKESDCQKPEPKPDPFAHLYAQVCKAPTSSRNSAPVTMTTTSSATTASSTSIEEPLDDVIFENLGII
ncbi:docking protein 1 [Xiphophorus couchianus]|uniref:docking protein 1 n=1 Tax=Xiphophorus couchianus TaxID=32473 RepID=UPI001016DDFE|nr:docking protein 1-like [Xiphophorus couchianus]